MIIGSITEWFKEAKPTVTEKDKLVQLGVHYEEIAEMAEALGHIQVKEHIHAIAEAFKAMPVEDESSSLLNSLTKEQHNALLDSLCDQIVTAKGLATFMGYDIDGALDEVNRSNWSKFENGKAVFDTNGKIKKGASYTPPDLTKFLNR